MSRWLFIIISCSSCSLARWSSSPPFSLIIWKMGGSESAYAPELPHIHTQRSKSNGETILFSSLAFSNWRATCFLRSIPSSMASISSSFRCISIFSFLLFLRLTSGFVCFRRAVWVWRRLRRPSWLRRRWWVRKHGAFTLRTLLCLSSPGRGLFFFSDLSHHYFSFRWSHSCLYQVP